MAEKLQAIVKSSWNMFEVLSDKSYMDSDTIKEMKIKFDEYRKNNIFLNHSFEDERWIINDEYQKRGIYFNVSKDSYRLNYQKATGLVFDEFIRYLKSYLVMSIGDLVVTTLINIANDIKNIINIPINMLNEKKIYLAIPVQLNNFFELLPFADENAKEQISVYLCECCDEKILNQTTDKRELCDFYSYFRFDHVLELYWNSNLSEKEWLFYFPIYLWWKLTAIIPTRPREYLLLPRDCIYRENNNYYIKMRKNNLKGGNGKVKYNINEDYSIRNFPITKILYEEILKYIELTDSFEDNEIHTLFRTEPHYSFFEKKKLKMSRYYTYVNLNCALRLFYYNVVMKKYGINILRNKEKSLFGDKKSIQYINLGDTRHIAMINAVAEGVSFEIIAEMAGHDSISMSAHYFSNMSTYIECRTYAHYINSLSDEGRYVLGSNFYPSAEIDGYVPVENGGRCYSNFFAKGNMSDCIKACGDNGEIGYCKGCRYYRNSDFEYFLDNNDLYRNKIDEDMNYLKNLISLVRRGKGNNEDIKCAMLKFKNDRTNFECYLLQKYKQQRERE